MTVDRLQTQDNICPDDIKIDQIDGKPRHLASLKRPRLCDITTAVHRGIDEWKNIDTLFIYGRI